MRTDSHPAAFGVGESGLILWIPVELLLRGYWFERDPDAKLQSSSLLGRVRPVAGTPQVIGAVTCSATLIVLMHSRDGQLAGQVRLFRPPGGGDCRFENDAPGSIFWPCYTDCVAICADV